MRRLALLGILLPLSLGAVEVSSNSPAVTPGKLLVDNPTINNLAFRWLVEGDANTNASVKVSYRRAGQTEWKPALPMLRLNRPISGMGVFPGNLFGGSVLNLEAASAYEVRFEMSDPDGGGATQTVAATTRTEPVEKRAGRRTVHVYPPDHAGKRLEPAFPDLAAAFAGAKPGDEVLLHAGCYTGRYDVALAGTPEDPILFRAAGDGDAILDGGGKDDRSVLEVVGEGRYLWFQGLTVRSGRVGLRSLTGRGCVFQRNTVSNCLYGISLGPATRDCYIADNTLIGRYTQWTNRNTSLYGAGINMAGRGHVTCHNRVRWFWDGISIAHTKVPVPMEWGTDPDGGQNALDICENDISEAIDDGIEADHGFCNIRVMRNRIRDSLVGISVQPSLCGPIYIIRNEMARFSQCPWKLYQAPTGCLIFHNTGMAGYLRGLCSANTLVGNSTLRNNLFLDGRDAAWIRMGDDTTMDYNGYDNGFRYNGTAYAAPADLAAATGQEKHGVVVKTGSFMGPAVFGSTRAVSGGEVDLRPRPDSPAIDAGEPLPTVNDGFAGKAPDLGAYEAGAPVPLYGPRPRAD